MILDTKAHIYPEEKKNIHCMLVIVFEEKGVAKNCISIAVF
jgi:hypothetical protein